MASNCSFTEYVAERFDDNFLTVAGKYRKRQQGLSVLRLSLIHISIWWGMEPRIMNTFMESYDFSGKVLANFCTSGGSGIATSTENLKALSPNANWLEGKRLSGSSDTDEIQEWIDSLKL